MSVRSKYGVDLMTEGEILVRGTQNPQEALKFIFEQIDCEFSRLEERLYGVEPKSSGHEHDDDYEIDPAAVAEFADCLHGMLKDARVGYYRKINVLPTMYGAEEGWGWMLYPAKAGKPGAFEGVEFP